MTDRWLDRAEFAAGMGWKPETVTRALSQTRSKIRNGEPLTSRDLPMPDRTAGRSPLWLESTFETFRAAWQVGPPGRRRAPTRLRLTAGYLREGDAVLDERGVHHVIMIDNRPGKVRLLVRSRARDAGRWLPSMSADAALDVLRW